MLIKSLKRICKEIIRLNGKRGKGINGAIEKVNGNKVSLRRIERRIDLTTSGDRVVYKDYDDWKYLQAVKGHPGTFQNLWDLTKDKQRRVWEFVGIKKIDNVLDVGFRDGFNLRELDEKCSSVVGIDINKHAIGHAKGLGCEVFQEDIQHRTHFEDNSFDVIILCDVLEHCFSPESVLKECHRLLKHSGRIIIEVPFENRFGNNLLHGHSSLFRNRLVFERLLISFGFSISKKNLFNKARNLYVVTPVKKVKPNGNKDIQDLTLTLFFTGGVGLKTWFEVGNLDRDLEIYKRLSDGLKQINFVTYGDKQDKIFSDRLGAIKLLPVKWHKRQKLTISNLLLKYYPELKNTDILKTNQIFGVQIPLWFKKRFGKKLIVRCGYLHARFTEQESRSERVIAAAYRLERAAFKAADIAVVTTVRDRDWVVKNHGIPREKLRVIPNYVDVKIFSTSRGQNKASFDLVYVGRSDPQKNILALLEAIAWLKKRNQIVRLLMIGQCANDLHLKDIVESERLDVTFVGNIPNAQLPDYLNKAIAFILPSNYEGHPKVLLEAMSCSMPCIGTNVEGIREEISHRETGYLCYTDPQSIAEAIESVLDDELLRHKMGENARQYILENYTLEQVLEMELQAIREVIAR